MIHVHMYSGQLVVGREYDGKLAYSLIELSKPEQTQRPWREGLPCVVDQLVDPAEIRVSSEVEVSIKRLHFDRSEI